MPGRSMPYDQRAFAASTRSASRRNSSRDAYQLPTIHSYSIRSWGRWSSRKVDTYTISTGVPTTSTGVPSNTTFEDLTTLVKRPGRRIIVSGVFRAAEALDIAAASIVSVTVMF